MRFEGIYERRSDCFYQLAQEFLNVIGTTTKELPLRFEEFEGEIVRSIVYPARYRVSFDNVKTERFSL